MVNSWKGCPPGEVSGYQAKVESLRRTASAFIQHTDKALLREFIVLGNLQYSITVKYTSRISFWIELGFPCRERGHKGLLSLYRVFVLFPGNMG